MIAQGVSPGCEEKNPEPRRGDTLQCPLRERALFLASLHFGDSDPRATSDSSHAPARAI